jgi:hypothetical protein
MDIVIAVFPDHPEEMTRARAILGSANPSRLDLHQGVQAA